MKATRVFSEPDGEAYDPWKRLAAAVVTNAMRDYFNRRDWLDQLDAALWLRSDESALFLDVLDLSPEAVMRALTGPRPRQFLQKKKRS